MKKQILSFIVQAPKTRAHYALFAENTPFKPKVVAPKNKYQRKPKHCKTDDQ